MMRTEDDLRSVFGEIADEFDQRSEPALDLRSRSRALRRGVAVLAVAAGVGAIVAVGAVITNGQRAQTPEILASPPIPLFSSDAELIDLPKGVTRAETVLDRGGMQSVLAQYPETGSDNVWLCVVTVGRGAAPEGAFEAVKATTVGSVPAQIGRGDPLGSTEPEAKQRLRVRWQPAPDRWADSTCQGETGDIPYARRIAESLRLSAAPPRVPWTARTLPSGLAVNQVTRRPQTSGVPRFWAVLAPGLGRTAQSEDLRTKPKLFISLQGMSDYAESNGRALDRSQPQTELDGHKVFLQPKSDQGSGAELDIVDGETVLSLSSDDLSQDEVIAVAKAITLPSNLGDEKTWGSVSDLPW